MNPSDPSEQILSNALDRAIANNSDPKTIEALHNAQNKLRSGTVTMRSAGQRRWPTGSELVVLAISIFCLGYALVNLVVDQRLAWTGVHTQGVVIDIRITRNAKGGDNASPIVKFIARNETTYQFTGPEGHYPSHYAVNQQVNVVYDPTNPSMAQIEGADTNLLLVIGAFGLLLLAVVTIAIRSRNR